MYMYSIYVYICIECNKHTAHAYKYITQPPKRPFTDNSGKVWLIRTRF